MMPSDASLAVTAGASAPEHLVLDLVDSLRRRGFTEVEQMQIKEEDIATLAFADFTLEKRDNAWQLKDLQDGQTTDAKAAADLVAKVSGLTAGHQ